MKLNLLFIFILFGIKLIAQQPLELILQQRGEIVVSVSEDDLNLIEDLSLFSIERPANGKCQVYLNSNQYNYLIKNNIPLFPEIAPSLLFDVKMASNVNELKAWDAYPTYETYVEMMQQLANDFPDYCSLDTIGYSVKNRLLLAVKISDNVNLDETEPEFFYTSSMHGDELVGAILMLRLADYLLNNMENEQVASLVNNLEIYINPLANPDGTYFTSNNTVNGATRSNANAVNLNRNFPDPKNGDHPDGYPYQAETLAMMNYMQNRNFVMSMNHHGGAELINYPWDTFEKGHPDSLWFEFISRNYADTVHNIDEFYMTDLNNGITNGYAWYSIAGGRQDYVNYFLNGREVTAELSSVKMPVDSLLPQFWDKNYKSLLYYMEQSLYGVSGFVSDSLNNPLNAKVIVIGHDKDNSHVYSKDNGVYYRYLKEGIYSFLFEADGYQPIQIDDVQVKDFERTNLSVKFILPVGLAQQPFFDVRIFPNPAKEYINIEFPEWVFQRFEVKIFDCSGKQVYHALVSNKESIKVSLLHLNAGMYSVNITNGEYFVNKKLIFL